MNPSPSAAKSSNLSDITAKYNNLLLENVQAAEKAKEEYEHREAAYAQLSAELEQHKQDIAASHDVSSLVEEINQALFLMEAEAEVAAELSADIAKGATGDSARDAMLEKAKGVLADLPPIDKKALLRIKEARANAEKEAADLRLSAATANMRSLVTGVKLAMADEDRTDAKNDQLIKEAANKIRFSQLKALRNFDTASELQSELEALMRQRQAKIDAAYQLSKGTLFLGNSRPELVDKLRAAYTNLLPCEKDVIDADAAKTAAEDAYLQAKLMADRAQLALEQKIRDRASLEEDTRTAARISLEEYNKLVEKSRADREEARQMLDRLTAEGEKQQLRLAELSAADETLHEQQNETAKQLELLTERLQKTTITHDELSGMLQRIDESAGSENNTVLAGTLEKVKEELSQEKQQLTELEEAVARLTEESAAKTQELADARQEAKRIDNSIVTAQQAYDMICAELDQQEKFGQNALDQLNSAADDKVRAIINEESISKDTAEQQREEARLAKEKLDAAVEKLLQAQDKREAAMLRANELTSELRQTASQAADQQEQQMLAAWRQAEELDADAAQKRTELQLLLNEVNAASGNEELFSGVIEQAATQAEQRMAAVHKHTVEAVEKGRAYLPEMESAIAAINVKSYPKKMNMAAKVREAQQLTQIISLNGGNIIDRFAAKKYVAEIPRIELPDAIELAPAAPEEAAKPVFEREGANEGIDKLISELAAEYRARAEQYVNQMRAETVPPKAAAEETEEALPQAPAVPVQSKEEHEKEVTENAKDAFAAQMIKARNESRPPLAEDVSFDRDTLEEGSIDSENAEAAAPAETPRPAAATVTPFIPENKPQPKAVGAPVAAEMIAAAIDDEAATLYDTEPAAESGETAAAEKEAAEEAAPAAAAEESKPEEGKKGGIFGRLRNLRSRSAHPAEAADGKENGETVAAQPIEQATAESEAANLTAMLEARRIQMAAAAYDKRMGPEPVDPEQLAREARQREEEEKQRLAEEESARIRAEEEAAQRRDEEEAFRQAQRELAEAQSTEQLARETADEISADDTAPQADEAAAEEKADDNADIERELRRLILSNLNSDD